MKSFWYSRSSLKHYLSPSWIMLGHRRGCLGNSFVPIPCNWCVDDLFLQFHWLYHTEDPVKIVQKIRFASWRQGRYETVRVVYQLLASDLQGCTCLQLGITYINVSHRSWSSRFQIKSTRNPKWEELKQCWLSILAFRCSSAFNLRWSLHGNGTESRMISRFDSRVSSVVSSATGSNLDELAFPLIRRRRTNLLTRIVGPSGLMSLWHL